MTCGSPSQRASDTQNGSVWCYYFIKKIPFQNLLGKSRDYVYGICKYKVLSMEKLLQGKKKHLRGKKEQNLGLVQRQEKERDQ